MTWQRLAYLCTRKHGAALAFICSHSSGHLAIHSPSHLLPLENTLMRAVPLNQSGDISGCKTWSDSPEAMAKMAATCKYKLQEKLDK